ncbi:DUF2894 domain-containing protein [Cupriavidus sp. H18C2]|uniref:DUF2894 domain-containing protein n=1 Tax=Cupriavidus sp. H18C2 TaxID=3241602 RepID=UPI003BF7B031
MHEDAQPDPRARLDAWRQAGADRADPVRFCLIDAMARRGAGFDGEARRWLDARLAALVAAYGEAIERDAAGKAPVCEPSPSPTGALADLAALTARLARGADVHACPPTASPTAPTSSTPLNTLPRRAAAEPALADYFRDTWARVSVERQLRQSQAHVPDNAGPLNTNHLVHRALSLMREVSPGYLEQFLSYVDALSWLEGMHAIPLVPERKARTRGGKAGNG